MSVTTHAVGITEILVQHRDAILRLAEKHGAYNVRVFGSVARGDATETSDVDFLVEWDYNRMSSWGGVGFALDLEDLLGRKVDVVSEKALHWRIKQRILAEAVEIAQYHQPPPWNMRNGAVPAMRDDRVYIDHILERITMTESFTTGGRDTFMQTSLIQEAVIRNFEVMGEAIRRVSEPTRQQYPHIPWQKIAAFRNVLTHDYDEIDLGRVWDIIEYELPVLKPHIESLLRQLDEAAGAS